MKYLFSVHLFSFFSVLLFFQYTDAQNYAVSAIPEDLVRGVNSVIRNDEITFSILDIDKVVVKKSTCLTVLNEKALDLANLMIFYNSGQKVAVKSAVIYNAAGIKTKSIRQSDMADYSTAVDKTLYSDQRVIYCRIIPGSYPFTIKYDYEITYKRLYALPDYSPYVSDNQSVESSTLTLINPGHIPINIRTFNLPEQAEIIRSNEFDSWKFQHLLPLVDEPYMQEYMEIIPLIRIAPQVLCYDKYQGKADTWENYGKWLAQLSSGRRTLSDATKSNLKKLVAGAVTPREKVRILYKYLQSRTHYINISLGIGGIQPHEASEVDELGYGDCKDLSNYMVAMLDAVGIPSFYTVVNSGEGEYNFIPDQPGHQFDHAIVCVPVENDTIWLECTNQIIPFGYIGTFIDNRNVLIIKDNAGFLARTPEHTADGNKGSSNIAIEYSEDGTSAKGSIRFQGILMNDLIYPANQNLTDQKAWINQHLDITDYSLIDHRFEITEDPEPAIKLDLDLALKAYFTGNNGRLFAPLNLNNKIQVPARVRNRKNALFIPYSYKTSDTVIIKLPPDYRPEFLPGSTIADEEFGMYSMRSNLDGEYLTCIRDFELHNGTFPADRYAFFYEFMQKSAIADAKQLVLIRQE